MTYSHSMVPKTSRPHPRHRHHPGGRRLWKPVWKPVLRGACLMGALITVLGGELLGLAPKAEAAGSVNIYSGRQEVLIRPLIDRFSEETGIAVNMVSAGDDSLLERLKREGANSPADVLLTVDAGRLIRAKDAGVLQAVQSDRLNENIPAQYRDPEGYWFGLTMRARPIIYARERVDPERIDNYRDLVDSRWRGRICVRSSNNIYNQSLLAALIAHWGAEETEAWARGLVANFARPPQGGDRDQIRAVASGECDLALANTYYLAGMIRGNKKSDTEAALKVAIRWPDQNNFGTHVNISGGAVAKNAPHPAEAVRFLEFLTSDEAQRLYADRVNEYPVKDGIPPNSVVASWGTFKADDLPLAELGAHNAEAVRIADRAGWR